LGSDKDFRSSGPPKFILWQKIRQTSYLSGAGSTRPMMAIVRLLQRQIEPTFLIQTSPYARRLGELYSARQQLYPENATNINEPGWVIMDYVMLPQRIVKAFDQPSCRGFMNRHESKIRRSRPTEGRQKDPNHLKRGAIHLGLIVIQSVLVDETRRLSARARTAG
jgi:hypothetical protein